MSFILDALKKSEIERQRQTVPGLMDTRIAQQRSRLPAWAVALGVLLGINLMVLAFVLTRGSTPPTPTVPQATALQIPPGSQPMHRTDAAPISDAAPSVANSSSPATGTSSANTPEHFSPLDTAPIYAPEIPVAAADGTPLRSTIGRAVHSGVTPSSIHTVHRADPLLTDKDDISDDQEMLPSISELHLTGAQALPELHLDVHVYATKPADRFVYINMRKYHEGATLQEGPTVEQIRRDGVALNFQGLRFMLPRQP